MKRIIVGAALFFAAGVWGAAGCGASRSRGTIVTGGDMTGEVQDFALIFDDMGNVINPPDGGTIGTHDPATCAEAMTSKSYIGCDYWPTVTANAVWSVFDYAVVISNPGTATANITVSGGALTANKTQTVAPGQLVKIGLPWVVDLKGPDVDKDGAISSMNMPPNVMVNSVLSKKGAYHLVSDVPVLVYQFNALEYQPGTGNNLNGVAWSTCPNDKSPPGGGSISCLSYSNDASLLLPSTAMTDNYIVTGVPGDDILVETNPGAAQTKMPIGSTYIVVTATADSTTVTIQLSKTGDVLASKDSSVAAVAQSASAPAKLTYMLNAGDALELLTQQGSGHDFTGSQIQSSNPVQLMVGIGCTNNPANVFDDILGPITSYSCDHVEESVLPIETWGKTYVVTAPTGPDGGKPGHVVRIYGGAMASTLTVTPAVSGAPATIAAGAVATFTTTTDFAISGTQPFAVSSEQMSAQIADPNTSNPSMQRGDPSLSFLSAVEQYRDKYLFLAPTDYIVNYVDIVIPTGAALMLDGAAITQTPTAIGLGYSVARVPLMAGTASGAHTLTGTAPFGIQVVGYGVATSYQYPGGLDLKVISAPPPPIL